MTEFIKMSLDFNRLAVRLLKKKSPDLWSRLFKRYCEDCYTVTDMESSNVHILAFFTVSYNNQSFFVRSCHV